MTLGKKVDWVWSWWGKSDRWRLIGILPRWRGCFLRGRFLKFWSWPLRTGPRTDLMSVVVWFSVNWFLLTRFPRISFFDFLKVSKEGLAGEWGASFVRAGDLDLDFGLKASIMLGDGEYMNARQVLHICPLSQRVLCHSSERVRGCMPPLLQGLEIRERRSCDEFNGVSTTLGDGKILSFNYRVEGSERCCFARWLFE